MEKHELKATGISHSMIFLITLVIAVSFMFPVNVTATCTGNPFGQVWGDLNGVAVLSNQCATNGSNEYNCNYDSDIGDDEKNPSCGSGDSKSTNTGMKWQCAEFVNRYYRQLMGNHIRDLWHGHANKYYINAKKMELAAFPNGGVVPPRPDDIIVASGGDYGHVAIVNDVSDDGITVAHQNWNDGDYDPETHLNYPLQMTSKKGKYKVGNFKGNSYPVKGWLRADLLGKFCGTWQCSDGTLDATIEVTQISKGKIYITYHWGVNPHYPAGGNHHNSFSRKYSYDKNNNALTFTWPGKVTTSHWLYDISELYITGSAYEDCTITLTQDSSCPLW